ncbi:hypothetical protein [Butyrivibrio sp. MC2013]|uniref:hypothetical protein n=1 Tax=Butyrivibrio sp. MC2013 TaxID=1280686 RepID=UPI0004248BBF|nr:hypothetical protein [Butyrivibrio sp. MC2013]
MNELNTSCMTDDEILSVIDVGVTCEGNSSVNDAASAATGAAAGYAAYAGAAAI